MPSQEPAQQKLKLLVGAHARFYDCHRVQQKRKPKA